MKKSFLLYSMLLLFSFGCTNNSGNNQGQSSSLSKKLDETFVMRPKEIQPEGTFVAEGNTLYKSLTFKGKKTVVVRDANQIELGSSAGGFLQMNASDNGGFAIIRKRMASKGLLTSSQELAIKNPLFDQYHSNQRMQKALDSYGVKRVKD